MMQKFPKFLAQSQVFLRKRKGNETGCPDIYQDNDLFVQIVKELQDLSTGESEKLNE